jgi:TetR/AcrR family tetracycline transcriptional repressor
VSRRDEVLAAALELLDEVGIDALTTRRLAERLGVQPGALYRHFASKRELLDAMVERIASDGPPIDTSGDWVDQVRAIATAMRAGMLAHRDGARLLATLAKPGPAALAGWQRFVDLLRGAGLTEPAAILAVDTILAYVNGSTIEEQARRDENPQLKEFGFRAGLDLIIAGIKAVLDGTAPPMDLPVDLPATR